MLTREEVLHARNVHATLYEATANPFYYAFIKAYDLVLLDELPESLKNGDLVSLIYEYNKDKSLKGHR